MSLDQRPYVAYGPTRKHQPIRDLIAEAVETFRWTHPDALADTLLLHPVHLVELGTVVVVGATVWMASYLDVIDPREVRVGPLGGDNDAR